jgi:hypothetical protein
MVKIKVLDLDCSENDCIFFNAKYCEECPVYNRIWHKLNDDLIAVAADNKRKKLKEDSV